MKAKTLARYALPIAGAAAVAAAGAYLLRGDRYRLYTDPYAERCWEAVHLLTSPTSSLSPVRVTGAARNGDASERGGSVEVTIGYHLDRVLGGAVLDTTCIFAPGGERAKSIEMNGRALGADALNRINTQLAG